MLGKKVADRVSSEIIEASRRFDLGRFVRQRPLLTLVWGVLAVLIICLIGRCATASTGEVMLGFDATSDMQTNLIREFPIGLFKPSNGFPAAFYLPKAEPGAHPPRYNFWDAPNRKPLSITTHVRRVSAVYMLLAAYSPPPGATIAFVEFSANGGAHVKVSLVAGTDIRDFCENVFANAIDGTSTRAAYTIHHVRDSCGTGNVQSGYITDYRIDEHRFVLPPEFIHQALTQIEVTPTGYGTPLIIGITAVTDAPGW